MNICSLPLRSVKGIIIKYKSWLVLHLLTYGHSAVYGFVLIINVNLWRFIA